MNYIKKIQKFRYAEVLLVALILIIAISVRLVFIFKTEHLPLRNDAYNYDVMTKNFLEHGYLGYTDSYSNGAPADTPNAVITPGYPLFLSIIYSISGIDNQNLYLITRIIQALLGVMTCLIIYMIGKNIGNKKIGSISSFFYSIYPSFVWAPTLILTETLYNFLFFSYFFVQIKLLNNNKWRMLSIACGVLFALAVLVRPTVCPLIIVPFIYQYIKTKDKKVIKSFVLTILSFTLVMLPWWIRNIVVLNKIVIFATQAGNPLIAGTFPYYMNVDMARYNVQDQFKSGMKYIIDGFVHNPILYLKWFTIGKFTYLFKSEWFYQSGNSFLSSLQMLHGFIINFGWFGVIVSIVKKQNIIIIGFVILLTALQLLFVPEARYSHAIIPLLMLLAAYNIDKLVFNNK